MAFRGSALVSSPPDIVSDVAGRRADQPLVGMLRAEFRHVEADVGALVSEQQAGDRLGKLSFADTRRPGEEGHAPGRPPRGDCPIPVTARLTISSMWVTACACPLPGASRIPLAD